MFLKLKGVSPSDKGKGFTLIELLIVAVIVAIIAAIAIPAYMGFIQRARETAVISFLVELHKGQEAYRLDDPNERYSGDFEELEETGFIPNTSNVRRARTRTRRSGQTRTTSSREQNNYRFDLTATTDAAGNSSWYVYAYPIDRNRKARWFYEDQTGIIRYEIGRRPRPDSPPI